MHDPAPHGAGRIETVRSTPVESVTMSLEIRRAYPQRVMSAAFDMDEMVGGDFAKGLADLKAIAER